MKKLLIITALILIGCKNGETIQTESVELTYKQALQVSSKLLHANENDTVMYTQSQYEFVTMHPYEALKLLVEHSFKPDSTLQPSEDTLKSDYVDFRNAMALRESTNNWRAINQFGYIGLFQFGRPALTDCGISIDPTKFKLNPSIFDEEHQVEAFDKWTKILYSYTYDYIDKYDGKTIHGIKVTTSGIIAGAHLVGHGNMKRWLNGETGIRDGNGVDVSEYVKEFAGFDITSHLNGSDELLAMN